MPSWPVTPRSNWSAASSCWNDPALQVRVGIHSGYVVAHVIEADFSSIYEAGGPAVHLVKRLEGAAQAGQILVSESCQSLSTGLVTFSALPPRRLEGFSAPVPCHELVEISGLTRWRARSTKGLSSFVGRAEEIALLERAARDIDSSGQVIALVGTAGIGKSRMAHEFVAALRQQDWQVLEAEGNPLEQAVPYALVKKLLQSALRTGNIEPEDRPELPEGPAPPHCRSLARRALRGSRPARQRPALERSRTPAAAAGDHRRRSPHDRTGWFRRGRPSCCWRICTGSTAKARPPSKP